MKFSIITCTRNSLTFIKDNIESVQKQTFVDYEHVFIDGFSTDGTKEIILEYQKKYPDRVKFFQFEAKGITNAMNHGIRCSDGEYIMHLHSDDYLDNPSVLKDVNNFFSSNNYIEWIYGKARFIDTKNNEIKISNSSIFSQFNSNNLLLKQILKYQDIICHQAVFIKRSVFMKVGLFDEKDKITADYDFWLRIMNKTKWCHLNKIICNFRQHENGYSSSIRNQNTMALLNHLCQKRNLSHIQYYIILPIFQIITLNYSLMKKLLILYNTTKGIKYL